MSSLEDFLYRRRSGVAGLLLALGIIIATTGLMIMLLGDVRGTSFSGQPNNVGWLLVLIGTIEIAIARFTDTKY